MFSGTNAGNHIKKTIIFINNTDCNFDATKSDSVCPNSVHCSKTTDAAMEAAIVELNTTIMTQNITKQTQDLAAAIAKLSDSEKALYADITVQKMLMNITSVINQSSHVSYCMMC